MDYDRLYILWQLAKQADNAIAEIGVYKGGSSWLMSRASPQRFYAFDTFEGHPEVSEFDGPHKTGDFSQTSFKEVSEYLKAPNVSVVQGDIRDTAILADDEVFSLVHIDVDVYPITKFCLEFFSQKLAPNGVIVIDDYGTTTCPGAKKAVDEFKGDFTRLHLTTGQILLIKNG
jgi:O-methyltransferase